MSDDGLMREGLQREGDAECPASLEIDRVRIPCGRPEGHEERGEGHRHKAVLPDQFGQAHVAIVWGDS